ncbi:MAG: ABC transporter ATP-binding protein [Cereibacter sphaeroides]|uniref:ABC transporter ATP-binding protein n=1 Tax=Cereibacter sphaeroides TaxID=1063 RepID=A0A2W5U3S6_CERSP|nr:MAG: ABC transporter ATP-binding protein [Cereibacter sphaeroides]
MLEAKNVSLSYGGVRAVDNVSIRVGEGQIVGLIGTNGAGKTSLFNVISGFTPGSAGTVTFDGKRIDGKPPSEIAGEGLLRTFQTPVGFPRMTVLENMLVFSRADAKARKGLFASGTPDRIVLEQAMVMLDEFGLASRANDWVQDLSAPELKMLEFSRAMMAQPRLLMLDEPAAGVNPAMMESLTARIRKLRDRGVTFLVVDHNLKFISAVCEEIFAMADGRLIAEGPAAEVIRNPEVIRLYIGSAA